jgi:MYXO-CTERM domain-containing protein
MTDVGTTDPAANAPRWNPLPLAVLAAAFLVRIESW